MTFALVRSITPKSEEAIGRILLSRVMAYNLVFTVCLVTVEERQC